MKDYKRLTNDWFDCRRCPNGECENPGTFCVFRERCEEYNRLKSLEDKIESGELGDVSEYKKHRVLVDISPVLKGKECISVPNTPPKIIQLYNIEEVEQILKERDEYKHRAEVAERALRNAAPRLNCRGGLGKGFCRVDKCDYYHCNNDEGCVKAHLQQAEKELQEERKDD